MEAEMKMALQPPRDLRAETCRLVIWGLVLAMLAWAWRGAEMKPMALVEQGGNILTLISDFFPPDFTDWRMYVEEMIVTLHVAIWGTLLAVICAVPLGIMSSENIAPWWICQPVRRLMDAARAINEMVFAMMFVVAVGLGPFAGVLALWVHTTGTLAKLFSEAVEAIEVSPVEGVRSTGASFLEEIIFGVIPQVFPLWISYSLYLSARAKNRGQEAGYFWRQQIAQYAKELQKRAEARFFYGRGQTLSRYVTRSSASFLLMRGPTWPATRSHHRFL